MPDLSSSQIRDIIDSSIYRYEKVEANKTIDKKCYISMNYGLKQYHARNNPYFNGNAFNIYIMCSRDIDFIEANGSRVDAIEHCIADIFEDGELNTIGKSRVDFSEPISIRGSDYVGSHISIVFFDSNIRKGEINEYN